MRWKKIAIAAAVVFAVLIMALYAFIEFYDFNKFKPVIAKAVKDATGRELTIRGDIAIEFGIRPTIVIEDVSFQNAAWSARPDLGRVKRLEAQIAVWWLITGKFDFARLVLVEPEVIVEFDSTGKSNFSFATGGDQPEKTKIPPPPLIFSDVLIEKGLFTYQDAESGFQFSVAIERMTANIPGFAESLQVDYKGTVNDIPLTLKGTVGPIWAWVEPGYSWPISVTASAEGATASIKGEIGDPVDFKDLAVDISTRGSSVAEITRQAGLSGVPELGAFKLNGTLSGSTDNLAVEKLDIQIGSQELAAISITGELKDVLDLRGMNLNFNARGQDSANLTKLGLPALPARGAFQISARISDHEDNVFTVSELSMVLGENEVDGQVILNLAEKVPFLTAELASKKFRFGQLNLDLKITDPFEKASIEKIDLKAGNQEMAEVRLNGKVDDLKQLQGVDIKFQASGKDLANLKQVMEQPPPLRGAFSASGEVLIPVHKNLSIPDLKISAGKNTVLGSLNLDLRGEKPQLETKLSLAKLDLPSVLLPELAKKRWARGLGQVRPVKLAVKLSGFSEEIAVKEVDLRAGSLNSAEVRLSGSVANLTARRGIDLKFSVRGNQAAKLYEITAQPYFFSPVPAQGAFAISGHISDSIASVYKVDNFKLKLAYTELTGQLDFDLAGHLPEYEVKLSGPKFSLEPFPIPKDSAYANLNKIDDLGPIKLQSKLMIEGDRLSLQHLDLQVGSEQLVELKVKGSIKNATAQKGIDLDVNIRGNEVSNLEKITGQSLSLRGAFAVSGKVTDPASKKYRIGDLKLSLGENNFTGRLDLNLTNKQPAFYVQLSAPTFNLQPVTMPAIKSLAEIKDLGPLKLAFNLARSGNKLAVNNLDLLVGNEQLAAIMLKGTVGDLAALREFQLEFAVKGKDLVNLKKMGSPELPMQGPFSVSGQLVDPSPKIYKMSALKATLGNNDAEGSLELNLTGQRPRVTAELSSRNIDLRSVSASTEEDVPPAIKPDRSETPAKKTDKIFSSEPLHLEILKIADADIKTRNKRVLLPKLAFDDIAIDLTLEKGNLTVNPIKFAMGDGGGGGSFKLLTLNEVPAIEIKLDFDKLDLGAMFDALETEQMTSGKLDGGIDVSGGGNSLAEIMAGLNGRIYLVLGKGRLAKSYLDLISMSLGSAFLRLFNPFQDKKDYTVRNCGVSRIEIVDGLADLALLLDTEQTTIVASGDINLKKETLDIAIKPHPKKGFITSGVGTVSLSLSELSRPFKLGGTLAKPALAIDPERSLITLGKLAGVVIFGPVGILAFLLDFSGSDENACLKAIESAKAKAEEQEEKKKSGGFFKRLFGK